jgi:hypothetical protein
VRFIFDHQFTVFKNVTFQIHSPSLNKDIHCIQYSSHSEYGAQTIKFFIEKKWSEIVNRISRSKGPAKPMFFSRLIRLFYLNLHAVHTDKSQVAGTTCTLATLTSKTIWMKFSHVPCARVDCIIPVCCPLYGYTHT